VNFLQIAQRVGLLLRFGDGPAGAEPETVVDQFGRNREVVEWVNMAYADIQAYHPNWLFMRKQGQITLTPDVRDYDPRAQIADLAYVIGSEAGQQSRYVLVAAGPEQTDQQPAYFIPYEQWRMGVFDRGVRSDGRPYRWTINPDNTMSFDPTPKLAHNVEFDYFRETHVLVTDTDEPIMPKEHHMAIVWWAINKYYCTTRENSNDIYVKSGTELRREMNRLGVKQLPEYTSAEEFYSK